MLKCVYEQQTKQQSHLGEVTGGILFLGKHELVLSFFSSLLLIEVQITENMFNHYKVYNSVVFSGILMLSNHHL